MAATPSLTLVTRVHAAIRRPQPPPLRLSPLLRHALATALPDPSGSPLLLPTRIPSYCCHDLFRCRHRVRWRLGDGRNFVFFCEPHVDLWWEAGNLVQDFSVERWRT
jgi:hypothetical protein